jgi:hypothetical protein
VKTMTHRLMHFTAAACAALTLAGTAYAVDQRSWDLTINDPLKRFIVLPGFGNQAVLDKETQLVWERTPSDAFVAWGDAYAACLARTTGGRMGWRLPTSEELTSLLRPSTLYLPQGHPFQPAFIGPWYWTATTDPRSLLKAHAVNVGGTASSWAAKTWTIRAWCVRGSQGYDGR